MRPLTLVPPQDQRARDVNARIGAGNDTDQKREREIVDGSAAEQIKRHRGEKYRSRRDDGSAEGLIKRLIHHFFEGAANAKFQVLTNSVEDNNSVVNGE